MLISKNNVITVQRLTNTGKKRSMVQVETGVSVYINQIQEDVVNGFDGEGSFLSYRMMTDGWYGDIFIWDKVIDQESNTYDVRGKAVSKDITGTHHQYLITRAYD